jgi:hypothetical protein
MDAHAMFILKSIRRTFWTCSLQPYSLVYCGLSTTFFVRRTIERGFEMGLTDRIFIPTRVQPKAVRSRTNPRRLVLNFYVQSVLIDHRIFGPSSFLGSHTNVGTDDPCPLTSSLQGPGGNSAWPLLMCRYDRRFLVAGVYSIHISRETQ